MAVRGIDPARRFRFQFADLAAIPEPQLTVLQAGATAAPGGAAMVAPLQRPRWLPLLLPVFRARDPLRVRVVGRASPAFAARLVSTLATIFASAGAEVGVQAIAWEHGFAVGAHGLDALPAGEHAIAVLAELEAGSVAEAARTLRSVDAGRAWLVLDGDVPALDGALGLRRAAGWLPPGRVVRLPLLGPGDLAGLRRGVPPGMARAATGRAYLAFAAALARSYLEQQP